VDYQLTSKSRVHYTALLFIAGWIEEVFSPNPWKKKLAQIRLVTFEKNAKNAHFVKLRALC